MRTSTIAKLSSFLLFALPSKSQQIRIRVLDAHHGKPVANECVEISLGHWHGADLFAPTNNSGLASLSFSKNMVKAEPVPGSKACGGMALSKSFPATQPQESLAVLPNYNVSCQYPKEQTANPAWLHNPIYQKGIPSFSLQDILAQGIVAPNTCTKLKPTAVPGELIVIVRKMTFMEAWRAS